MSLPRSFPFGSATALVRALKRGEVSSVELLRAYLARVERLDPRLNAIVVRDDEAALRQARAADRARAKGRPLGALHGLPMTVKEAFDLAGHPTTHGSPAMRQNMATEDALAVQRLKAAGAVVFGKSNVPLYNADMQSYNAVYGTTHNPWDLARGPGGSSGGSAAAVAAGLAGLEYGSDIGGSIRNPAAYCGVYGHKPSWCLVPKRGNQLPRERLAEGELSVVGPLARSAQDLATALAVTQGPDALLAAGVRYRLPAPPKSLKGLRIAVWSDDAMAPVDASIREAVERSARTLQSAGARLDFDARPAFDPAQAHDTYNTLLMAQMSARRPDYDELLAKRQALDPADGSAHARQLRRATASYRDFLEANHRRERLRWAWHDFFSRFDALLMPATCTTAFAHDHSEPQAKRVLQVNGQPRPYFDQLFWAGLATASLLPATVAPAGLDAQGLPLAVQIVGPELADRTTIWLAAQLERLQGGFVPPPMAWAD